MDIDKTNKLAATLSESEKKIIWQKVLEKHDKLKCEAGNNAFIAWKNVLPYYEDLLYEAVLDKSVQTRCEYCGCKNKQEDSCCCKCGAPL